MKTLAGTPSILALLAPKPLLELTTQLKQLLVMHVPLAPTVVEVLWPRLLAPQVTSVPLEPNSPLNTRALLEPTTQTLDNPCRPPPVYNVRLTSTALKGQPNPSTVLLVPSVLLAPRQLKAPSVQMVSTIAAPPVWIAQTKNTAPQALLILSSVPLEPRRTSWVATLASMIARSAPLESSALDMARMALTPATLANRDT